MLGGFAPVRHVERTRPQAVVFRRLSPRFVDEGYPRQLSGGKVLQDAAIHLFGKLEDEINPDSSGALRGFASHGRRSIKRHVSSPRLGVENQHHPRRMLFSSPVGRVREGERCAGVRMDVRAEKNNEAKQQAQIKLDMRG